MKLAVRLALSCIGAALVASPASAFWWHRPVVVVNVGPVVAAPYGAGQPAGGCYGRAGHHAQYGHGAPVMMAPVGAYYPVGAPPSGSGCGGGYGAPPSGCNGGYGAPPSGSGCSGGYGAPPPCPPDKKTTAQMQRIDRKLDELLAAVRGETAPAAKGPAAAGAADEIAARVQAWKKDELNLAERIRHWQEKGGAATVENREPLVAPTPPAVEVNLPALTRGPKR